MARLKKNFMSLFLFWYASLISWSSSYFPPQQKKKSEKVNKIFLIPNGLFMTVNALEWESNKVG